MFSGRLFDAVEKVGYCYETLVYTNLVTKMQSQKSYSDGVMYVTVKEFFTWVFKVSGTFLDRAEKKRSAWIVPARFCFMQFINDNQYLFGEKFMKIQLAKQQRKNKVSFLQISSPDFAFELKDY